MFAFVCLAITTYCLVRHAQLSVKLLLLHVQIQVYRDSLRLEKKRLLIPEWVRRLFVWVYRFARWLGWKQWKEFCLFVRPATVIDWHKRRYKDFWTFISTDVKRPGRPEIPLKIIRAIRHMARENPMWGPERIQGEIWRVYHVRVHRQTVRKYMPERSSDPDKRLRWKQFLKANLPDIAAMDFFIIARLLRTPLLGFFVIAHDRRRLLHINITQHPTAEWIKAQLLLALPEAGGLRYLLSDNDRLFEPVTGFIKETLLLARVRTQHASPWQNGIAERFIRTLRGELLNYLVPIFPFSEAAIRQRLLEYRNYYNEDRTHSANNLDSPESRAHTGPPGDGRLVAIPRVGGLHHRYYLTGGQAA